MGLRKLLRCIGEAVCAKGLKALMSLVPFGDAVYAIASDAYERLKKESREDERTAAVVEAASASLDKARLTAEAAVAEIKAHVELPVDAEINLVRYLTQVPSAVRQSLKRPADPSGKTVPPAFALKQAEQLLPMLPTRLPAFKAGDRPAGCGNWELVELLGTGGFGEVWLARHPTLHSIQVALKFCLDASAAAVLRHEAALLNRVMEQSRNYQGFVTLRQAYLDAEPPCLEYDYVAGGDLIGLIADWHRAKQPPLERINKTLQRLATIVAHAHGMSPPIVHRDLKPANILVDRGDDNKARLRVADFGIGGVAMTQALAQQGSTSRQHLLATALRGAHTPHYASPQQARGEAPDPRDDVHALGVIWYQMLTNELGSGVPADWMTALKEARQPNAMIELFGKCLASKAENRLANAGVLATRLGKLMEIVDAVLVVDELPLAKVTEVPIAPVAPTHKSPSPQPATQGARATPPPLTGRPPLVVPTGRQPPPLPPKPVERDYDRPPAPRMSSRRSNAQVCVYHAPGLRLRELVRDLENWFVAEGFTSQALPTDDGVLLQVAQRDSLRQTVGMATALNVSLSLYRDELEVEIGAGNWSDKAAAGVVGMFVLWPLAVRAAIGAYNQSQAPARIFARITEWLAMWRLAQPVAAPAPLAALPPAPFVPPGGLSPEVVAQLKALAELRASGALSDEEFAAMKAKLLG